RFQPPADAPPAMDGRISDSGEGDDATWLDAAPVGTVVRDRDGDPWTHTVMPGAHPAPTTWKSAGGALTLPATRILNAFGPVTVVSVPDCCNHLDMEQGHCHACYDTGHA